LPLVPDQIGEQQCHSLPSIARFGIARPDIAQHSTVQHVTSGKSSSEVSEGVQE